MSDLKERILTHACDLFLEGGADGFSMRKLARRLGVTAPALYKHVESKEALLQEIMAEAYRRFSQYLYRGLVGATPAERFQLAGQGFLDFALENPRLYSLLHVSPESLGIRTLHPDVEALGCAIGQFFHDRVRECMDTGLLREGDSEAVSTTLWAHAHGLVTLYNRGVLAREREMPEEEFRELFQASSRRLLQGLVPDGRSASGAGNALLAAGRTEHNANA